MADELPEGADFHLRSRAQAVELLGKLRCGTRDFAAVAGIQIFEEGGSRGRCGALILRGQGRGSREDQTENGSRNEFAHDNSSRLAIYLVRQAMGAAFQGIFRLRK